MIFFNLINLCKTSKASKASNARKASKASNARKASNASKASKASNASKASKASGVMEAPKTTEASGAPKTTEASGAPKSSVAIGAMEAISRVMTVFIILVLTSGEKVEFGLPEDQLKRNRRRRQLVRAYINANHIDKNTRNSLKKAARSTVDKDYPIYIYTTLSGVPKCVKKFLTGKSMSGPRNYETDPWADPGEDQSVGCQSNAGWPQLKYTLAILHLLFDANIGNSYNKAKFYTNLEKGNLKRCYMYSRDLYYLATHIHELDHTKQAMFLKVMHGVPPFNSSAFSPDMVEFVKKLEANVEYQKGAAKMLAKIAAKKAAAD